MLQVGEAAMTPRVERAQGEPRLPYQHWDLALVREGTGVESNMPAIVFSF